MSSVALWRVGRFAAAAFAAPLGSSAQTLIPVAKAIVYPGDIISAEALTSQKAILPGVGAVFATLPEEVIGKVSKRTILPGQPIPRAALHSPYLVQQGKEVPLTLASGALTITSVAIALEPGSAGDTVRARNAESGAVVGGRVQPDGSLRVDLP